MLHDYQRKRILTLIDPTSDPLGAGYHIIQATIAIGSGGTFGKGWLEWHADPPGVHSRTPHGLHLRRLSEERGLLGNAILLLLYLLLIGRG
jgi:rod shape determining protein RodA